MQPDRLTFHATQITPLLRTAQGHVEQLVLLCGGSWQERTALLQMVAGSQGMAYTALGLPLAETLLTQPPRQRPLLAEDTVERLAAEAAAGLALDHIEILFDPELHIDPLRLAQALSRRRTVLLSWPGAYTPPRLTYAQPDHAEYRLYQVSGLLIYTLENLT
ncbi:MAG: BREX-3 system P-loop-containing protein BrxF [Anaerolineales bacterium]|nr:BREX-3 system P-loop-containing protein BrxF [Anaerolineales bacterium]